MNHWLVKSEPESYSWDDFIAKGQDHWDGVRNYQARNFMKEMQVGDQVFFYHSGKERSVVGIAEVARAHYPDPTIDDERWVAVDLKPRRKISHSVSLTSIKANPKLGEMKLLKNTRLSVQPVSRAEFDEIISMGTKG